MQDASSARARAAWLLASTPIVLLLTHYAAVLPHEFMHSFVAWILGIKPNPLLIHWGGTSLLNVLLLVNIDEHVDYSAALAAGKTWQVALIAFAGPGLANGGLYLLSRRLIRSLYVASRPLVAYGLFWFLFMNLANLYDYVPLRTFAPNSDVWHFREGTGLSPWAIYALGGYLVLWGLVDFYRVVLPWCLEACGFVSPIARAVVLVLATLIMFGYFAVPGLLESDAFSQLLSRTSLLAIPVIVVLRWRPTVRTVPRPRSTPGPLEPAVPAPQPPAPDVIAAK
jgi:hypothetical protein